MRRDRPSRVAHVLEWTLFAIGVVCLARYGWLTYQAARIESDNRSAVTRMLAGQPSALQPSAPEPSALEPSALPDPSLIGELDIPRLRLSAAVVFGDDANVLSGAVGYLPDTALPWERGNTVFAAHRDRLFRSLARVRAGDEILLSTRHGDFQYRVIRTFVVNPRDVWVLEDEPEVDLTLLTCYPFVFVGHAPQRFVVRARKMATLKGSPYEAAASSRRVRPGPDVEREGDE